MFKFLPMSSALGERFTSRKLSSPFYRPPFPWCRLEFDRTIAHGSSGSTHLVAGNTYDSPIKACIGQKTSLLEFLVNIQSNYLPILAFQRYDFKFEGGIEEGGGESMPQPQQDKLKKYLQRCPTSLSTAFSFLSYSRYSRKTKCTYLWLSDCRPGTMRCFNTGKDDDTVDAASNDRKHTKKATTPRINPTPKK